MLQVFCPFHRVVSLKSDAPWSYTNFLAVPKIKFIGHCLSYVVFLLVYAQVSWAVRWAASWAVS